jgi:hypothetical protein
METIGNEKPIKSRDTVVQKDPPSCALQQARQSGEPLQRAEIHSKTRNTEHLKKVKDRQA